MNSQELRVLQEAYNQVYDEGYKSFPHGKVEAKAKRLGADSRTNEPLTGKSDSEVDSILARKKKSGERATSLNLASRTAHSYLPQKKAERNKTQKEQVDLYDIILSHLLDEGYADTQEAAEAIMVNMSEDWRESIIEAVDPDYTGPSQDPLSRANRAIGNAVKFATGQQAAEVRAKQKGVPGNVVVKQSGPFSTKNVPTKGSFISDTEMKKRGQSTKPMGYPGQ